jgi:hypothetical protein
MITFCFLLLLVSTTTANPNHNLLKTFYTLLNNNQNDAFALLSQKITNSTIWELNSLHSKHTRLRTQIGGVEIKEWFDSVKSLEKPVEIFAHSFLGTNSLVMVSLESKFKQVQTGKLFEGNFVHVFEFDSKGQKLNRFREYGDTAQLLNVYKLEMDLEYEGKRIVKKYHEAIRKRDWDGFFDIHHLNSDYRSGDSPPVDPATVVRYLNGVAKSFPDFYYRLDSVELAPEGDAMLVNRTFVGNFFGTSMTKKPATMQKHYSKSSLRVVFNATQGYVMKVFLLADDRKLVDLMIE